MTLVSGAVDLYLSSSTMSHFRSKKLDLSCFINAKVIRDHTKRCATRRCHSLFQCTDAIAEKSLNVTRQKGSFAVTANPHSTDLRRRSALAFMFLSLARADIVCNTDKLSAT